MRFCFTSSNPAFVFHVYNYDEDALYSFPTKKRFVVPELNMTPNYGVTWDDDTMYVCSKTRRKIIAYNKDFIEQGPICGNVDKGTHQILCYKKKLYMVSTNTESLHIYDLRKRRHSYFDLLGHKGLIYKEPIDRDTHHYNSVRINDNRLYLSAHNFQTPSFIDVYRFPKLKFLERIHNVGSKVHGIGLWKDDIYTLDSAGTKAIVSVRGDYIGIGAHNKHFAKGLSITDNMICAAYSPNHEGPGNQAIKRMTTTSTLVCLGPNGIFRQKKLKNFGQIHEIRCLDQFDYVHGIKPFLTS